MSNPTVAQYRAPRARIAVAYTTKDRVELTRVTVAPLLDDPALDLYWFDGSATDAGRQLPIALCHQRAAICELHQGVVGGPDRAIMYALETLRTRAYDYVVLMENDVLLSDGWLEAMSASIGQAEAAGFKVGGATVRVFDRRVLSFNGSYCLMLVSGAGFIALTPDAVEMVLAHYRTLGGAEFIEHFHYLTRKDLSASVEFAASQRLSVDFIFDLVLCWYGLVVAAPAVTFAKMIDGVLPVNTHSVTTRDDHLHSTAFLITNPNQICLPGNAFPRFQPLPDSERLLIGCHQLYISVNAAAASLPVRAEGMWRRKWLQALGPFGLVGSGRINIAMHDEDVGLLVHSPQGSDLRLVRQDGSPLPQASIHTYGLMEVALNAADAQAQDVVLEVVSGEVCLIGLTASPALAMKYANPRASIDHLPA
jgi:hypothetical protein